MPFEKSCGIEHYQSNSLLTESNIRSTFNSIGREELDYMGIKLLIMPIDSSSIERRVGVNRDAITVLKISKLNCPEVLMSDFS